MAIGPDFHRRTFTPSHAQRRAVGRGDVRAVRAQRRFAHFDKTVLVVLGLAMGCAHHAAMPYCLQSRARSVACTSHDRSTLIRPIAARLADELSAGWMPESDRAAAR